MPSAAWLECPAPFRPRVRRQARLLSSGPSRPRGVSQPAALRRPFDYRGVHGKSSQLGACWRQTDTGMLLRSHGARPRDHHAPAASCRPHRSSWREMPRARARARASSRRAVGTEERPPCLQGYPCITSTLSCSCRSGSLPRSCWDTSRSVWTYRRSSDTYSRERPWDPTRRVSWRTSASRSSSQRSASYS